MISIAGRARWLSVWPVFALVAMGWCAESQIASGQAKKSKSLASLNTEICGPRAVYRVLQYYREDSELVDLVREMQWPYDEVGTNLGQIEKALNKRGVNTHVLTIAKNAELVWPYPVVQHWVSKKSPDKLGHFVVWLPTSTVSEQHVWIGTEQKYTSIPTAKVLEHRSSVVLLTAPTEIAHPETAVAEPGSNFFWLGAALTGSLSMALVVGLLVARGRLAARTGKQKGD